MKQTLLVITTFLFILSLGLLAQQQTADGGTIIAGTTLSYTHGSADLLVYKLDAAGNKLWRKNYGGGDGDYYSRVIQTSDGGYAVCGQSYSYTHGSSDFLIYKLDASGAKLWRKNYGGSGHENCINVVQTSDGGYALSGYGDSFTHGMMDLLVYKLDASGAKLWRKNYGGSDYESRGYIIQTSDGGYVLCGRANDGMDADFVVFRLDASGTKQWRKYYGGVGYETATVVRQTADGGYMVGGYGNSYATASSSGRLKFVSDDFLVYKLDASGAKEWRKNYGGTDTEHLYDLYLTDDGGYILFGDSSSYNYSGTDYDFLIYKLDASGAKEWRKNYGGEYGEYGWMAFPLAGGGYLLFGDTDSYVHGTPGDDQDLLVYKVDAAGGKQWRKNYGGSEIEWVVPK